MKIAIVDDEKICRDKLIELLSNYKESEKFTIDVFNCGKEFLREDKIYDIIFLDIEMPEIDGISLANKIITKNDETLIFYITSYASLVTKAINNYAFTFIPKPINQEDLFLELERALKKIENTKKILLINTKEAQICKLISEIKYIESLGKKCLIHMNDENVISVNERLVNFVDKLNEYNFIQCHKSYFINLKFITELKVNQIILNGSNDCIPIGRKYETNLKEKFNLFLVGISL